MADREKVIRGLIACNRRQIGGYGSDCQNCPYYDDEDTAELPFGICNIQDMFDDALALLKEREPRVMTLEELHPDLWIWMEYPGEEEGYDKYIGYAYLEGRMGYADLEGGIIDALWFLTAGAKERLVCPLKSYGQVWRCWTSRPSPEQMRETKWEDSNNE